MSSYTPFSHSINISECRIAIKFCKDPLAAEKNNYLRKIINVYIVYDLDALPRNPINNLKFEFQFEFQVSIWNLEQVA